MRTLPLEMWIEEALKVRLSDLGQCIVSCEDVDIVFPSIRIEASIADAISRGTETETIHVWNRLNCNVTVTLYTYRKEGLSHMEVVGAIRSRLVDLLELQCVNEDLKAFSVSLTNCKPESSERSVQSFGGDTVDADSTSFVFSAILEYR
jgi:hypothetical protein